jgi:hypothetical protein
MLRLQITGVLAAFVPLLTALPAETRGTAGAVVSPEEVLKSLAKAAEMQPNPLPLEPDAGPRSADVPRDYCAILAAETIKHGRIWYGLEDDNGWPTFLWDGHFVIREKDEEALANRVGRRLEKLGYSPTPHTTEFDRAFHRKNADADFLILLTKPQNVPNRIPPIYGMPSPEPEMIVGIDVSCRVRSTHRWSLPTYAEALRAFPCLELTEDSKHQFPAEVFKTLMGWPVASVSTRWGKETEICVQLPMPPVLVQRSMRPADLFERIPNACLSSGYEREEPVRGKVAGTVRIGKFNAGDRRGKCRYSCLEIVPERRRRIELYRLIFDVQYDDF